MSNEVTKRHPPPCPSGAGFFGLGSREASGSGGGTSSGGTEVSSPDGSHPKVRILLTTRQLSVKRFVVLNLVSKRLFSTKLRRSLRAAVVSGGEDRVWLSDRQSWVVLDVDNAKLFVATVMMFINSAAGHSAGTLSPLRWWRWWRWWQLLCC